jgi:flagellin
MGMIINTNVAALNAQRNLSVTGGQMAKALERLSSGLRINRAADDAAGLAISEKMRAQIRGMQQGLRNAQDGVSMIQTAEGALSETHAILQRMRELTVQAGSTTLSTSDREAIGEELVTLKTEIDNIATRTRFNGLNLLTGALSVSVNTGSSTLDGDTVTGVSTGVVSVGTIDVSKAQSGVTYTLTSPAAGQLTLTNGTTNVAQTLTLSAQNNGASQVLDFSALGVKVTLTHDGTANNVTAAEIATDFATKTVVTSGSGNASYRVGSESGDNITVTYTDVRASALGNGGSNDLSDLITDNQAVSTTAKADTLLSAVDTALGQVSTQRAKLGAAQNQMESAINSLGVSVENLSASESRIRDADIAAVSSELVTRQIMQQAGIAVLAQANAAPQSVLSLLQ